jgi:putative FmdB family regulatory protein
MPLYEYHCAECNSTTEVLRPITKADEPVECRICHSWRTSRKLSVFSAFSKTGDGGAQAISGTGGCGSCAGGHCASCSSR